MTEPAAEADIDHATMILGWERCTCWSGYIVDSDYVMAALRTAQMLNADKDDWQKFVDDLKHRRVYTRTNRQEGHIALIPLYFETKLNGIPLLSNRDIVLDAVAILKDLSPDILTNPEPVDIERFVESYLGLNLDFNCLSSNQTILGRMVFHTMKVAMEKKHCKKPYREIAG